jgi:hypothetical protein
MRRIKEVMTELPREKMDNALFILQTAMHPSSLQSMSSGNAAAVLYRTQS